MGRTFMYFAYGSNLLAKRIHINNPSAVRAGIGKISDYQLDFLTFSKSWRGASATIVERPGRQVWGAIWEIDMTHLDSLDRQEGVRSNFYHRFEVDVYTPTGDIKRCYVYQQTNIPSRTENIENLPEERMPSAVYLNIIKKGAKESDLPVEYQRFLSRIPHNGYTGEVSISHDLHLV